MYFIEFYVLLILKTSNFLIKIFLQNSRFIFYRINISPFKSRILSFISRVSTSSLEFLRFKVFGEIECFVWLCVSYDDEV
jgi:hypothetical protein